jgi:hypothetical protein
VLEHAPEASGRLGVRVRLVGHADDGQSPCVGQFHPLHGPHLRDDHDRARAHRPEQRRQPGGLLAHARPAGTAGAGRPSGVQRRGRIREFAQVLLDLGRSDADDVHAMPAPGEQPSHLVRPTRHPAQLVDAVGDEEDVPLGILRHARLH